MPPEPCPAPVISVPHIIRAPIALTVFQGTSTYSLRTTSADPASLTAIPLTSTAQAYQAEGADAWWLASEPHTVDVGNWTRDQAYRKFPPQNITVEQEVQPQEPERNRYKWQFRQTIELPKVVMDYLGQEPNAVMIMVTINVKLPNGAFVREAVLNAADLVLQVVTTRFTFQQARQSPWTSLLASTVGTYLSTKLGEAPKISWNIEGVSGTEFNATGRYLGVSYSLAFSLTQVDSDMMLAALRSAGETSESSLGESWEDLEDSYHLEWLFPGVE